MHNLCLYYYLGVHFRCIECIWYKQEYDYFFTILWWLCSNFQNFIWCTYKWCELQKSLLKNFWKLRQQNWLKIRQWTLSFHFTKFVYDLLYIGIFNKKIVRTKNHVPTILTCLMIYSSLLEIDSSSSTLKLISSLLVFLSKGTINARNNWKIL